MIKIKEVSFSYQDSDRESLRNINLHVEKGECVLICGKSGCGKTTLTRLINGLVPNFYEGELTGDVCVGNVNPCNSAMHEISQRVGSVFQNPRTQFYTVNTTSEIAFGLENLGMESQEIADAVRKTAQSLRIEHLLNRSIFKLSGGEKQMIALASVVAMNQDVYVLDEPSSNLDADAIEQLARTLVLLKKRGKTILIAEHRVYYLRKIADRALYMEDGEISREYTMEELTQLSHTQRMETGIRVAEVAEINRKPIEIGTSKGLSLRNVIMSYGSNEVLHIEDIQIPSDGIIAITGRNGVGKSTFVSGLCGLLKCKGNIMKHGIVQGAKMRMKQSYIVLQEVGHQLFCDNVADEVILGIKNADKNRLKKLLIQLDIAELAKRHPHTLSGGEKQRVAIAAGLFCGKQVLVFDEPTSGLDYTHMQKTAALLQEISKLDIFILVITHDMEFVRAACNYILHIEDKTVAGIYKIQKERITEN